METYVTFCQKFNSCKYDLVINGFIKKTIVTYKVNREAVLIDLIKKAGNNNFKILLTEDKVISVLLDSRKDKQFINFLYEDSRQA